MLTIQVLPGIDSLFSDDNSLSCPHFQHNMERVTHPPPSTQMHHIFHLFPPIDPEHYQAHSIFPQCPDFISHCSSYPLPATNPIRMDTWRQYSGLFYRTFCKTYWLWDIFSPHHFKFVILRSSWLLTYHLTVCDENEQLKTYAPIMSSAITPCAAGRSEYTLRTPSVCIVVWIMSSMITPSAASRSEYTLRVPSVCIVVSERSNIRSI